MKFRYPGKIYLSDHRGLTLMETIIYVSLIGSVFGSFITFALMASDLRNKMHAISEVKENIRTFEEISSYFIRNSEEVSEPGKQSTSTSLSLKQQITGQNILLFLDNGQVFVDDGSTTTPITTNDVYVSDLNFYNNSATGTNDFISIIGKIENFASTSPEYYYEDMIEYKVSVPILKL